MPNPDQKIWLDVLSYLKSHHPDICRQWFEDIEPMGAAEGVFRVRVHQSVQLRYLARQCGDRFTEALQAVTGRLLTVRFLSPEDEPARGQARPASNGMNGEGGAHAGLTPMADAKPGMSRPVAVRSQASPAHSNGRHESLVISPDYTFENFVVGPENRLAHAATMAVSQNPGRAYNPLFIHGGVGLGKTHLLQSMCLRIMSDRPELVIHYVSCDGFMTHFFDAVQAGQMTEFRHRFRDVDVLVIDDIHFLTKNEKTQEEFFHTFNTLHQSGKQIVLSSDAAPQDIPDLEARLMSRFQCGLVVEVNPPCYETRVQIVKQKARIRGLELPAEVAEFIAGRVVANIRELEGAIVKVQMQSLTDRLPITPELARQALGGGAGPAARPEVTINAIIDSVVDHYGVKLIDLQSKRRQKSIAHPRQVCMYLARRHTRYSLEEIGGYFGGRDHTTVMHAVRTVDDRRNADADFSRVLAALEARIAPAGAVATAAAVAAA